MPRCMVTFSSIVGVSHSGPFFIRVKWGRDGAWSLNPHITQNSTKDKNGNHVWTESIIIQSKFDWTKDSIVAHVYETGIFTNTHVGDAQVIFNQLVKDQVTPLSLPLTQRLGAVVVPGKLNLMIKALDFGHELVQMAQPVMAPHYFIASTNPATSLPSASPFVATPKIGGQPVYIHAMASDPNVQQAGSALPTVNNGQLMFYGLPADTSGTLPSSSLNNGPPPPYSVPMIYPQSQYPYSPPGYPNFAYPSEDSQMTADFTYEAPSAPLSTLNPPVIKSDSKSQLVDLGMYKSAKEEEIRQPSQSHLPNNGESFI